VPGFPNPPLFFSYRITAMTIGAFKGLNNVADPMRLDLSWLAQGDNVNISDTGALSVRDGYTRAFAGAITGAFSTFDYSRMYIVDGGALKVMTGPTTAATLATGLSSAPMYWAEVNDNVYYNNGVDRGIIRPDNSLLVWGWVEPTAPSVTAVTGSLPPGWYQVRCTYTLPDGRMTGSSDSAEILLEDGQALQISGIPQAAGYTTNVYIAPANSSVYQLAAERAPAAMLWNSGPESLGRDLAFVMLKDPLPLGTDVIQVWKGIMYAAEYMPLTDQTVVWYTEPLAFHLFNLNEDLFLVPGRVLMMAPHHSGLIIGTEKRVFAYTGKAIEQVADYGVVPGWAWARDDDDQSVLLWTTRGACRALPFVNLTFSHVSVAPGVQAGAAVVRADGQKKFVVALHAGGTAFNQRV